MRAVRSISLLCALLTGCATFQPDDVVNPAEVTLDSALESVGAGLRKMLAARGKEPFGLVPSEVEVTFKIGVSAKDASKLTIDTSRSSTSEEAIKKVTKETKAGVEVTQSSEALRDNAIKIKFVNVLTIPKDTLAYEKPGEVTKVLEAIKGHVIMMQPQ